MIWDIIFTFGSDQLTHMKAYLDRHILAVGIVVLCILKSVAQNIYTIPYVSLDSLTLAKPIDLNASEESLAERVRALIYTYINRFREENGLSPLPLNTILDKAAANQALWMLESGSATPERDGGLKTTLDRVRAFGGASGANVAEIVGTMRFGTARAPSTWYQALETFTSRLERSRTSRSYLLSKDFVWMGIGVAVKDNKTTAYVSVVFGDDLADNSGTDFQSTLPVSYSTVSYGLDSYDSQRCGNSAPFQELEKIRDGFYLMRNWVFLELDDEAVLSEVLKGETDALAVEIIQRDQYKCGMPPIYDKTSLSRGILLSPATLAQLQKADEKKGRAFKAYVGKASQQIGDFEFNAILVRNNSLCWRVPLGMYVPRGDIVFKPFAGSVVDTTREAFLQALRNPHTFENPDCNTIERDALYFPDSLPAQINKVHCDVTDIKPQNEQAVFTRLEQFKSKYNSPLIREIVDVFEAEAYARLAYLSYESQKTDKAKEYLQKLLKKQQVVEMLSPQAVMGPAYIAYRLREYVILHDLLERVVLRDDAPVDIYYWFLLAATKTDRVIHSWSARNAAKVLLNKDRDNFCKMIGYPNLSFQLLNDQYIMKLYCEQCR